MNCFVHTSHCRKYFTGTFLQEKKVKSQVLNVNGIYLVFVLVLISISQRKIQKRLTTYYGTASHLRGVFLSLWMVVIEAKSTAAAYKCTEHIDELRALFQVDVTTKEPDFHSHRSTLGGIQLLCGSTLLQSPSVFHTTTPSRFFPSRNVQMKSMLTVSLRI